MKEKKLSTVMPAVSGVRGADEQQKTKFGPTYSVRLQEEICFSVNYAPGVNEIAGILQQNIVEIEWKISDCRTKENHQDKVGK